MHYSTSLSGGIKQSLRLSPKGLTDGRRAIALQQEDFKTWKNELNQTVSNYQQAIVEWLAKSQEFFPVEKPIELIINFPEPPHIEKDNFTKKQEPTNNYEPTITEEIDKIFNKAVNTILSGNAQELFTSFTGNSQSQSDINKSNTRPQKSRSQIYAEAAENYLTSFSQQTFISLQEYQNQAEKLINYQPQAVTETNTIEEHQLQLLDNAIENLQQELNNVTKR